MNGKGAAPWNRPEGRADLTRLGEDRDARTAWPHTFITLQPREFAQECPRMAGGIIA